MLLNYISSHQKIYSSAVSNWIKTSLKLSVASELSQFVGHSTRSSSTFKAHLGGFSVNDILCRGSWSNESTWQHFYHKENFPSEKVIYVSSH